MKRRPEVRGSVVGLLAFLGRVTALAWLMVLLLCIGATLPLMWFGPPYGVAVGLGCAQLLIVLWGGRNALRSGLKKRLPEGPPESW